MEADVATNVTPFVKTMLKHTFSPKGFLRVLKTRIDPYWSQSLMGTDRVV